MPKYTKAEIAEARETLLGILGPLTKESERKVYCLLRHVSKSGMSRRISFFVADSDGDMRQLDGLISKVCTYADRSTAYPRAAGRGQEGLKVGGCGMDMGFSVVYHLSRELYGRDSEGNKVERAGYFLRSEWL